MAQLLDLPQELLDLIVQLASFRKLRAVNKNLHNLSNKYLFRHVTLNRIKGRNPFPTLSLFLRTVIEDKVISHAVKTINLRHYSSSYFSSDEPGKAPRDSELLGKFANSPQQFDGTLAKHITDGDASAQAVLLIHLLPKLLSLSVVMDHEYDDLWICLRNFRLKPTSLLIFPILPPTALFSLKTLALSPCYTGIGDDGLLTEFGMSPIKTLPAFFLPSLSSLVLCDLGDDHGPVIHPQIASLYGTSQVTDLSFIECQVSMANLMHMLQLPEQLIKLSYSCAGDNDAVSEEPFESDLFGTALGKLKRLTRSPISRWILSSTTDTKGLLARSGSAAWSPSRLSSISKSTW